MDQTRDTKEQINKGNNAIKLMRKQMNAIEEASNNVFQVIKAIDGIAEQTNLLALNAAIEAARAGEVGRGFAVVADEVRSLANHSSKALDETRELIKVSLNEVANGVKSSEQVENVLSEIEFSISHFISDVETIAENCVAQANEVNKVNFDIHETHQVTVNNAEIAEQNASVSEQMSDRAEQLTQVVARFNLKHTG